MERLEPVPALQDAVAILRPKTSNEMVPCAPDHWQSWLGAPCPTFTWPSGDQGWPTRAAAYKSIQPVFYPHQPAQQPRLSLSINANNAFLIHSFVASTLQANSCTMALSAVFRIVLLCAIVAASVPLARAGCTTADACPAGETTAALRVALPLCF
jgi:hypothetical protein